MCRWQGTPLSYATDQRDNELAMTDCNGFVLYVAGQDKVTDVSVADGTWHHVAVTWQSQDGVWNIYKDGQPQDGGRGLATGRLLQGSTTHSSLTSTIFLYAQFTQIMGEPVSGRRF